MYYRLLLGAALVTSLGGTSATAPRASLPPSRPGDTIDSAERSRTISALRPPKRARPVVAILAQPEGTETTDFIVPYSILKRSGVADVWAVGTHAGPITLHPVLKVQGEMDVAGFDARYPNGADYVIVPAVHHEHDKTELAWILAQRTKGATIVGVCSGVKVLSAAGLLDDRHATGHWYDVPGLRRDNPTMHWVRDRRYVADRGIVTTTGVTASIPISLALVEAIAGRDTTAVIARQLGVTTWDATHNSAAFSHRRWLQWTAVRTKLAFWNRETIDIAVAPGVDELALALSADSWSRTYRSHAETVAQTRAPVPTRNGLALLPDRTRGEGGLLFTPPSHNPALALDSALATIETRYGSRTASFVALQLEYARQH